MSNLSDTNRNNAGAPIVESNVHRSVEGQPVERPDFIAMVGGQSSGIGDAGDNLPTGSYFGKVLLNKSWSNALTHAQFPNQQQHTNVTLGGTFYVYREQQNGQDDYFVAYKEDGLASKGDLLAPPSLDQGVLGYFVYRMDTQVGFPENIPPIGSSMSITSPATTNSVSHLSSQTVDTKDHSVTVGYSKDGASSSVTYSDSTQTWTGLSTDITDWSVVEETDGSIELAKWRWFQNMPWSGENVGGGFTWWQQAYTQDWHGRVKSVTELSSATMQFHSLASWRFPKSLIAADGTLKVTFRGEFTIYYAMIFCDDATGGSHQISYQSYTGVWEQELDLIAIATPTKPTK